MQMRAQKQETAFATRTAFLLNANARAVSGRVAARLQEIVPAGDLFLSRSLDDAAAFADTIARRGYGRVFTGGGDGTIVSTVNLLEKACAKHKRAMPAVGVLKLGTGNAVAGFVGAKAPLVDAYHAANDGPVEIEERALIVTDDGVLTPFAGMGYDGEVLNDYYELKNSAQAPWFKALVTTVVGYLVAMLFRTVPRHFTSTPARVRVVSTKDAWKMVATKNGDEEVRVPAGTVLYEGPAPVLSVGAFPYFGFGFTMFPFATRKAGMFQLRVCATSIPKILVNLWPSVWKGTFRDQDTHDFLVEDVVVEGDRPLAYQVGGDASGARQKLHFKKAAEPLRLVRLGARMPVPTRGLFGTGRALPAART